MKGSETVKDVGTGEVGTHPGGEGQTLGKLFWEELPWASLLQLVTSANQVFDFEMETGSLSPRLEFSGTIVAQCSLQLLGP
ncbi:hypothetical protein AAY473_030884, partial [Plecturocebus cupreus]